MIFIDMPEVPSAAIGFITKVGQRDGGLDKYEIAHVLEHLVFDGTRQFPRRQDLSVAIDEIGAEFDGSTYEEFTSYCLKTGPRNFPRAALLLSEIILRPLLLNSQLEKEKKVIFQELNLREDDPIIKITDSLQETVFPGHPLGCSREKSRLSLRKLKIRDLKEFWQKKYVSKNSVLVICGDLEKQGDLHLLTKDYFDDLTRGKPSVIETVPKEKKAKVNLIHKRTSQVHLALGGRSYPLSDSRIYAAKLLDLILGHSFSSRLFQEIRERRKLAYAVFSSVDFYQDTGVYSIYAGVDQKAVKEAVQAILKELKKIVRNRSGRITSEELTKAKNCLRGRMAVQLDDPVRQIMFYGRRLLFYKETLSPEDLIEKYERVSLAEVIEVAKDLFRPEKLNLVVMGQGVEEKKLEKLLRK